MTKETVDTVDVSDKYPPMGSGRMISASSLTADRDDLEVYAFVAASSRMFWYGTDRETNILRQKKEQLKLLGFTPVIVIPEFILCR